jgi:putative transcriptional regulator
MNSEIDFFKIETNNVLPEKGRILIAEPFLNDIYFKRSIILLTEHNTEGSIGFVLNKPVNMKIDEIIIDFPAFDCNISIGGPVSTNTVHYIHTLGEVIPNSVKVCDNIYWGGDFDFLKELIKEGALKKEQVKFFLGYSGWMPNQLRDELEQNSWLVCKMDGNSIMDQSMDKIWSQVLSNLGGKYKMWVNSPENPSMN